MATETEASSAGAPASNPAQANPTNPPAANTAGTPKLTNAELKAKQKAEKAAKRAQAKASKGEAPAPSGPTSGSTPAEAKGNKGKKEGSQGSGGGDNKSQQGKLAPLRRPSTNGRRSSIAAPDREKDVRSSIPECFSHLAIAKRIPTSQAHKDVHPAVLAVGQQMATFTLRDSIARLEAMLLAFRKASMLRRGCRQPC